jgi:protein-tyrosine phosphatase
MTFTFAEIHCHLLPGIDDGAKNWDDSLAMDRLAAEDEITTVVATRRKRKSFTSKSVA